MRKITLMLALTALSFYVSKAQLADGSVAPNFTLVDLNGTSHTLYDYLDQGKTVVINISDNNSIKIQDLNYGTYIIKVTKDNQSVMQRLIYTR